MKSITALASLTAVASAQLFPDCVNGPLANNSVCDVTKSMFLSPPDSNLTSLAAMLVYADAR